MPLKLLGKKSWHVYNTDNVARVRRDEAAAQAEEEEEERQRRELESDRRAALLRREAGAEDDDDEQQKWTHAAKALSVDAAAAAADTAPDHAIPRHARAPRRPRKRRGEDDTDFEMRLALERREQAANSHRGRDADPRKSTHRRPETEPTTLVDSAGHIDLFGQAPAALATAASIPPAPPPGPQPGHPGGPSMRFADAGGRDGFGTWYTGQAPPKRSFASSSRRSTDRRPPIPAPAGSIGADPLAVMKQAAATVRALKQERLRENAERSQALAALIAEQKHAGESRRRDGQGHGRDEQRRHRSSEHVDRHKDGHRRRPREERHADRSADRSGDRAESPRRHSSHRRRSRSPRRTHRARSKSP